MSPPGRFLRCLAVSLVLHASFFAHLPSQAFKEQESGKPLEVFYQQDLRNPVQTLIEPYVQRESRNRLPVVDKTFLPQIQAIQDKLRREIFKDERPDTANPKITNEEEAGLKVSVDAPNIPGEIPKSAEYKSYYQIIREKIRKHAYSNYKRLHEGEVYLSFSINAEGTLLDAGMNAKRSTANEYLRGIALQSVREAAPYPAFPPKLKNKEKLSFNVLISFELK